jgi:hypothetical protein
MNKKGAAEWFPEVFFRRNVLNWRVCIGPDS